ncbi:MarR family winged helix-turn-helix transcriptional regulator [Hansschlegelia quercus]|uniref:MarR family transcriptional regulator n=1 Tax=Hansschlegelia quercus TaxID=2528245 RepID=A0A4V2JDX0_9HYPH|nr:MarR family transcriptional regulator [Hansschlegelia quercus]TBN51874.1 MarR family transcriptional regulator [Hansschlegelia quercus]
MHSGDPETASDFGFELGLVARRWRRALDEALASSGLTDASWRPLVHLARLGDGARQHDLARSLGIEGPTLVRMLDRLADAGLVERRQDPTDRRAKTLRLTEAGRTAAERAGSIVGRACEELIEGVEKADIEACLRVFQAVLRRADGEAAQ